MFTKARHTTAAVLFCATAALATAQQAEASTVVDGTVSANGVDYIFFDFSGGTLQMNVNGISLADPMIRLFADDGSSAGNLTGSLLGTNDDGGPGLNSQLTLALSNNSYVLAVGAYYLEEAEARSGIASTPFSDGTYQATFSQTVAVAGVPLPASLPLMIAGLGAIGVARRRKAAA